MIVSKNEPYFDADFTLKLKNGSISSIDGLGATCRQEFANEFADQIKLDELESLSQQVNLYLTANDEYDETIESNVDLFARYLNLICANTMVMVGRDYIKAGNKVCTKHNSYSSIETDELGSGIEYGVITSFYVEYGYQIMALTLGLARSAIDICFSHLNNKKPGILELVDYNDVIKAINNNDPLLARQNWLKIKDRFTSILGTTPASKNYHPINAGNVEAFEFFVEKGLNHFNLDPIIEENWSEDGFPGYNYIGWEKFADDVIKGYALHGWNNWEIETRESSWGGERYYFVPSL